MEAADGLALLSPMCTGAKVLMEGGRAVAFLPDFQFPSTGGAQQMDLLLVPFDLAGGGYKTRLLFASPPPAGSSVNWRVVGACGRSWHAPSWQGVAETLPWDQMLAAHLRCLL